MMGCREDRLREQSSSRPARTVEKMPPASTVGGQPAELISAGSVIIRPLQVSSFTHQYPVSRGERGTADAETTRSLKNGRLAGHPVCWVLKLHRHSSIWSPGAAACCPARRNTSFLTPSQEEPLTSFEEEQEEARIRSLPIIILGRSSVVADGARVSPEAHDCEAGVPRVIGRTCRTLPQLLGFPLSRRCCERGSSRSDQGRRSRSCCERKAHSSPEHPRGSALRSSTCCHDAGLDDQTTRNTVPKAVLQRSPGIRKLAHNITGNQIKSRSRRLCLDALFRRQGADGRPRKAGRDSGTAAARPLDTEKRAKAEGDSDFRIHPSSRAGNRLPCNAVESTPRRRGIQGAARQMLFHL